MHRLVHLSAVLILLGALFVPFTASALGISFGGRIASINFGPGCINFIIIPAGAFPISYIFGPGSIPFLAGPPTHPGQQVLGVADAPTVCVGFGSHPPVWPGLRVQIIGTSLI